MKILDIWYNSEKNNQNVTTLEKNYFYNIAINGMVLKK